MNRYVVKSFVDQGESKSNTLRNSTANLIRGVALASNLGGFKFTHGVSNPGEIAFHTSSDQIVRILQLELSNYGLTVYRED